MESIIAVLGTVRWLRNNYKFFFGTSIFSVHANFNFNLSIKAFAGKVTYIDSCDPYHWNKREFFIFFV